MIALRCLFLQTPKKNYCKIKTVVVKILHVFAQTVLCLSLVDAHTCSPARLFLIHVDLERKWVTALCGYGRDVVLMRVGEGDDFHGSGE